MLIFEILVILGVLISATSNFANSKAINLMIKVDKKGNMSVSILAEKDGSGIKFKCWLRLSNILFLTGTLSIIIGTLIILLDKYCQ